VDEATAVEEPTAVEASASESAQAPTAEQSSAPAQTTEAEPSFPLEPAVAPEHAAVAAPIDVASIERIGRREWKRRRDTPPKALYPITLVLLVLALGTQGILEFRDALAAYAPVTRPVLERTCALFGCAISPLRDTATLSIDASDLQADPAHRGLLLLTATIRNRAAHPIAYPNLELTLTDSSDQVVVRRAFPPAEYAGGTTDLSRGIAANGERIVRIFIDASATQQAGYRLYLFYP
jgi:hypothetical protein